MAKENGALVSAGCSEEEIKLMAKENGKVVVQGENGSTISSTPFSEGWYADAITDWPGKAFFTNPQL